MMPESIAGEFKKIKEREERVARNKSAPNIKSVQPKKRIFRALELMAREFDPLYWIIVGLLTEGLFFICGRPKLGKSWLVLDFVIAVASGGYALGKIKTEEGESLYVAHEDGDRRLHERIKSRLGTGDIPRNLFLATEWSRFDNGGLEDLENFIKEHPKLKLVVFDTFEGVRAYGHPKDPLYHNDYHAVAPLQNLAKKYRICILLVHHTRKAEAFDHVDTVSGSTGLTGAADGILILKRSRGQADATLTANGRDFQDAEIALRWDNELTGWTMLGDAREYRRSTERQNIVDLLKTKDGLTPKVISDLLGRDRNSTKQLLRSMSRDGELHADNSGRYSLNGISR